MDCALLLRCGRELSPKCALPEEYLSHNRGARHQRAIWCLAYLSGGVLFHQTLRFLEVRETLPN